ncbi:MAG: hypothetical protein JSR66_31405 [Proteobacteria bacterium]|nr:hypothetical protein [Pseudomonadota bacterium]
MYLKLAQACALVAVSLLLAGCAPGKRPFSMVQMCLSNQQGIEELIDELKSIAAAENLEFIDNSSNAERGLIDTGYVGHERTSGSRALDIRIIRRDGMGIGATNVGLPGYQVAVGFAEGSNAAEAQDFAKRVLSRFKKRWLVQIVPGGAGAGPMAGCR